MNISQSGRLDTTVELLLQYGGEAVVTYTFDDFQDANALLLQLQSLLVEAQAKLTLLDARVNLRSCQVELNLGNGQEPVVPGA